MVKKIICLLCIVLFSLSISGCNWIARKIGGDISIDLPDNTKFINATWKNSSLWYLTRPMKDNENAEVYEFKEDSNFGILEGTVTFVEHKK